MLLLVVMLCGLNNAVVSLLMMFGCAGFSGQTSLVVGCSSDGLDDVCTSLSDLYDDDDSDLLPREKEPEAWSVTVDIKTLKRLNSKDIKRQDHIWGQAIPALSHTQRIS